LHDWNITSVHFFQHENYIKRSKNKEMVKTDSHKINQLTSLRQNNDTRKLYYTMTKPTRMNKRAIWIAYVNGGVNQNRLQTRTASYHVPRITQALLTAGKRDHRKRCGLKSWHWTWKDLRKKTLSLYFNTVGGAQHLRMKHLKRAI